MKSPGAKPGASRRNLNTHYAKPSQRRAQEGRWPIHNFGAI